MPAYYRCDCGGQAVPPQRLCDQCIWGAETVEEPYRLNPAVWHGTLREAGARADVRARLERALEENL